MPNQEMKLTEDFMQAVQGALAQLPKSLAKAILEDEAFLCDLTEEVVLFQKNAESKSPTLDEVTADFLIRDRMIEVLLNNPTTRFQGKAHDLQIYNTKINKAADDIEKLAMAHIITRRPMLEPVI